jgi:hypothetical protein
MGSSTTKTPPAAHTAIDASIMATANNTTAAAKAAQGIGFNNTLLTTASGNVAPATTKGTTTLLGG